jgi:ketosteroid isomerase-like protein
MSQENVETVKAGSEAWIRGDLDAYFELCDPAVEWDTTNYEGWPEDDLYHGHAGVRLFLEDWRASWEQYEAGVEQYLDIAIASACLSCGGSEASDTAATPRSRWTGH